MVYSTREVGSLRERRLQNGKLIIALICLLKIKMQDVAFGDFTVTEREALFEDASHSIEVKNSLV